MINTFGIDIGTNSIKIVKLIKTNEKFTLQTYCLSPTPTKAILSEAESDIVLLAETIKKAVKDTKITTPYCVTALPESQVVTVVVEMPVMSNAELTEAIRWEAEQYIPQPLNEVRLAWDVVNMPKKGEANGKMKVLIVAAPLRIIDRYLKILTLADLKPVAVETEVMAILRSLQNDLADKPALLINLGASATQLAIIEEGNLIFNRSIAIGGITLARAVASELGLDIVQAEEYKKSYGLDETKLQGKVKNVIKPLFENLISEARKAVSFYKEKTPDKLIAKAILTGGSARLPGLVGYLAEELSLEVLVGNPWNTVALDPTMTQTIGDDGYIYATAVGLAMKNIL